MDIKKEKQNNNLILVIIDLIFIISMVGVIVICSCFSGMEYACKTTTSYILPNSILLPIGIVILVVLFKSLYNIKKEVTHKKNILLIFVSLLFLIIQIIFVYN